LAQEGFAYYSEPHERAYTPAGELAKAYDQARISGQACEASYAALSTIHR